MIREIKESYKLAISLLLISILLIMTFYFGISARKAVNFQIDYSGNLSNLASHAVLYKYVDSKHTISGSDIVKFISEYNTKYKYRIITDTETYDIWKDSQQHSGALKYYIELMGYSLGNKDAIPSDVYFAADIALWTQSHLSNEILKEDTYRRYTPYVTLPNSEDPEGLNRSISGVDDMDIILDRTTEVIFNFKIEPK